MNANGWDVLSYAMLALLIGVLLWFVIARWIDERRQKREAAETPPITVSMAFTAANIDEFNEAMRRYREHR